MTHASIITIGDEILIGQVVDTNSAFIASRLEENGVGISSIHSISDNHQIIIDQINDSLTSNDIVITTGGLGPTKDDITKQALYDLSGSESYIENEAQKEMVTNILRSRGLDILPANRNQYMVPDKCEVIVNRRGTAPIMVFTFPESRYGHKAMLISMPGVPFEVTAAMDDVLRAIRQSFDPADICHRSVMTYGLAESALAQKISDWESSLPSGMHLAYLPNPATGVRLRLSSYGGDNCAHDIEEQIVKLKDILGGILYSTRDSSLQEALGDLLRESGKTISAAESCTGGMIAHLITTVGGSSEYFLGSVTSYSPKIKCSVLGVSQETIAKHGIVSPQVACEMAEGVRKLTGSTYSVATTGWADSYGDEHEPAGTVWVAVSGPDGTVPARFNYKNDRKRNIERFAASALNELRKYIIGEKI